MYSKCVYLKDVIRCIRLNTNAYLIRSGAITLSWPVIQTVSQGQSLVAYVSVVALKRVTRKGEEMLVSKNKLALTAQYDEGEASLMTGMDAVRCHPRALLFGTTALIGALSLATPAQAQYAGEFGMPPYPFAFEVDVPLNNVAPNPNWDGASLTKWMTGSIVLSATNGYTGATWIDNGVLALASQKDAVSGGHVANDAFILASSGVVIGLGGKFDISYALDGARIQTLNDAATRYDPNTMSAWAPAVNGCGSTGCFPGPDFAGIGIYLNTNLHGDQRIVALGNSKLTILNGGYFSGVIQDEGFIQRTEDSTYYYYYPQGGAGVPVTITTGGILAVAGGTLILTGANTYTGGTEIDVGTLQLGDGGTTGSIVGNVTMTNNGALTFNRSDMVSFAGRISGMGMVNQIGTGTTTLTGLNTYAGNTNVNAGTLRAGGVDTFSPNSAVNVALAGTLDLAGFNQTIAGLTNSGVVNMGTGTTPGTVLTVTGNYVGDGGTIVMNTVLGDETSATDKLWVQGSTSGTTKLSIVNAGGLGALTNGNGIQVVKVDGASNGTFSLSGRVAAGAWDYTLFKNGVGADVNDGDWYLRSASNESGGGDEGGGGGNGEVAPRGEVQAALSAQALAAHLGFTMLGTYHDRTGGEFCTGKIAVDGHCEATVWARIIVGFGTFNNGGQFTGRGASYDYSLGGLQSGVDLFRTPSDTLGFYAGAATARGNAGGLPISNNGVSSLTNGKAGLDGYSLGGYWTRHGASGWYTDTVLQGTVYDQVNSSVTGGSGSKTGGYDVTASLESGVPFALGGGYVIEPQGQLVYQHLHLNDASDRYGRFLYGDTDTLYGRVGARLFKNWTAFDGRAFSTWARVNVWHTFTGLPQMTVTTLENTNPASFTGSPTLGRTWGQLGVGISGEVARNINLFGTMDYTANLGSGSGYSLGGRVGMRVNW